MTGNEAGRLFPMRAKTIAALLAAALALSACGGSTTGPLPALSEEDLAALRSDPRVVRIDAILGRSDALLFSSLYSRYTLTGGGETLSEAPSERMSCAGGRCTGDDGTTVTVRDLTAPSDIDANLSEAALGSRGGFDSVVTRSEAEVTESVSGATVTADPSIRSWGFWGEHGFAALELGSGPLSGEVDGTAFSGDFSLARAWAAGEVSGSNPAGAGGATWTGIAEASPTGRFERLMGTARVTIADLSRPRVGVAIDVPGHDIGAPGWADMPLTSGSFVAGTAGIDWLGGNFHGPRHEEAWGVFDTADYLGVFGAKREP